MHRIREGLPPLPFRRHRWILRLNHHKRLPLQPHPILLVVATNVPRSARLAATGFPPATAAIVLLRVVLGVDEAGGQDVDEHDDGVVALEGVGEAVELAGGRGGGLGLSLERVGDGAGDAHEGEGGEAHLGAAAELTEQCGFADDGEDGGAAAAGGGEDL